MSEEWDVESYRTEFESEEHWELRKNFMLMHKGRLSEDEIVCLAQVFTNIEFLGCRYPDETMRKVAELAKGVVESYREKKKNCLKRTFIAASDAAASKVKGLNDAYGSYQHICKNSKKTRHDFKNANHYKEKNANRISRKPKFNFNKNDFRNKPIRTEGNGERHYKANSSESIDTQNFNVTEMNGPFADFVLFISDDPPENLLLRNAALNKFPLRWEYSLTEHGLIACSVYINDQLIGNGEGKSKKISKKLAAKEGIEKLQSSCYTIKIKAKYDSHGTISPAEIDCSSGETSLPKCNIGVQMMKLMGWKGGGLGTKQQGAIEPINLLGNTGRSGLGLKCTMHIDPEFKSRAGHFIRIWMESNTDEDLIFTSEFSTEQRRILHELARNLSLRSKSYGKGENRLLVVSKKPSPMKIVEELMKVGGITSKYELIVPK